MCLPQILIAISYCFVGLIEQVMKFCHIRCHNEKKRQRRNNNKRTFG